MPTIAVATDFSTRSDRAMARAALLAKAHSADLFLLHVIDDDQPSSVVNAHRLEADKLMSSLKQSVSDLSGVPARGGIFLGDPFQQIPAAVSTAEARMLVMGPHRRQVLRDQFRGTTVERAIRRSTVPVLVANAVAAGGYRDVLLTTDLSPDSAHSIRKALSLPFLQGSAFSLLHVFEPLATGHLGRAFVNRDEIAAYVADEETQASSDLREFSKSCELSNVRPVAQAVRRSIERDVLDAADKWDAQLIVVGAGQKRFLEAVMLGSVAEGVLRDSERDVLVIPSRVSAS